MTITLEDLERLLQPEGLAAMEAASETLGSLSLHTAIERLRRRFPDRLASAALEMVQLRDRAREKFSRADRMLLVREALEQSSHEIVARHRSRRFQGKGAVTDLCCGIGGDALALASVAPVTSLDLDPARAFCCAHNSQVYEVAGRCETRTGDAQSWTPQTPTVFVDPARRIAGQRVRGGDQYSPPLSFALETARRVEGMGLKLSPAEEYSAEFDAWERELVSLDGSCRELALWYGSLRTTGRRATVLKRSWPGSFDWTAHTLESEALEDTRLPTREHLPTVGDWLIEPDPAVIRGRLVGQLGASAGASLIDPEIAYLLTQQPFDTPFGSTYRVLDAFPYSERRLGSWLRSRRAGRLIVKKRGFPLSPEQVRAKMKLQGEKEATVILTRRGREHLAILVESESKPFPPQNSEDGPPGSN